MRRGGPKRCGEDLGLTEVCGEFENPDGQQVVGAGDQQADVGRQDGQEVDDAEEADRVSDRAADADQAEDVFDGEEDGEKLFDGVENGALGLAERGDAVEDHRGDADHDGPN